MESLLQIAANVKIIEKSPKGKVNAICNEGSKTSSLMSTVVFCPLISCYDDTSNIYRNSYGSLCLESLLQIATNVKIIDKR